MASLVSTLCLVCSHPNPANHFADFAEVFKEKQIPFAIYAEGAAAEVLKKRHVSYTPLDQFQADQFDKILFDVSPSSEKILSGIHHDRKFVWMDNPEGTNVPGEYGEVASRITKLPGVIALFAKGIGYSSLPKDVEKVVASRVSPPRKAFLAQHGIEDRGQKIIVYFGGASEDYYFLQLLDQLQDTTIVLQSHPRAKKEEHPGVVLSKASFDEALAVADVALYYQTSANTLFYLSGIPTCQVAKEPYLDLLVRNGLCPSAIFAQQLEAAISYPSPVQKERVYQELGYTEKWPENLLSSLCSEAT